METPNKEQKHIEEDVESTEVLPSFIKTWKQLYIFEIGQLVALILLFYWFGEAFK